MGVKTIKEKYRIGHIVQKRERNILIGSPYISAIIVINPEGQIIKGIDPDIGNKDLIRYVNEMIPDAQSGELKRLFHAEDVFGPVLPVFTAEKGRIVKKFCETFSWPNTTTDGEIMDSSFFRDRVDAKSYLKTATQYKVKTHTELFIEALKECGEMMLKRTTYLGESIWHYILARILP